MRRLAVFVEGYTELLFVDRLISEIAGPHNVVVEQRQIRGGVRVRPSFSLVTAMKTVTSEKYHVLVVDCGGEDSVRARINEQHQSLTNKGYEKIIGIRDVRPNFSYKDIPKLEMSLKRYVKTSLIPVEFVLSVMEIEAWFLAEYHHFPKIHASISLDAVKKSLGFDPEHDDLGLRSTPTSDLRAAYQLGGEKYETAQDIARTVNALDYPYIYFGLKERIPYLKSLCLSIDNFLG